MDVGGQMGRGMLWPCMPIYTLWVWEQACDCVHVYVGAMHACVYVGVGVFMGAVDMFAGVWMSPLCWLVGNAHPVPPRRHTCIYMYTGDAHPHPPRRHDQPRHHTDRRDSPGGPHEGDGVK